jgi:hypothetical protein
MSCSRTIALKVRLDHSRRAHSGPESSCQQAVRSGWRRASQRAHSSAPSRFAPLAVAPLVVSLLLVRSVPIADRSPTGSRQTQQQAEQQEERAAGNRAERMSKGDRC